MGGVVCTMLRLGAQVARADQAAPGHEDRQTAAAWRPGGKKDAGPTQPGVSEKVTATLGIRLLIPRDGARATVGVCFFSCAPCRTRPGDCACKDPARSARGGKTTRCAGLRTSLACILNGFTGRITLSIDFFTGLVQDVSCTFRFVKSVRWLRRILRSSRPRRQAVFCPSLTTCLK